MLRVRTPVTRANAARPGSARRGGARRGAAGRGAGGARWRAGVWLSRLKFAALQLIRATPRSAVKLHQSIGPDVRRAEMT